VVVLRKVAESLRFDCGQQNRIITENWGLNQAAGCTRREWPEVDATYRRYHVEGCIATALPQAAETIRRLVWWPAVLLPHGYSDSTGVRLPCVALQSNRCTDEGFGVAAAQSDAGQRLHDVVHQSLTRHTGVATRPADRTIFPAQCPAEAFTICFRTSAIPLSRTDCDIQETLKH